MPMGHPAAQRSQDSPSVITMGYRKYTQKINYNASRTALECGYIIVYHLSIVHF